MTLVNPTMEPTMANLIDGSFFEEIVWTFMAVDSLSETTLPCTIYLPARGRIGMPTRLGRLGHFRPCPNCASVAVPTTLMMPRLLAEHVPTDISEIMQLCDKPPLVRCLNYRFSYHFCNHRIGRKLFMDFFYYPRPDDIGSWALMRYGVDDVICNRLVDRPFRRPQVVLHGDVLLDTLAFLNCDSVDLAQLVSKSWRRSIDASTSTVPLRQFAFVQVVTVAPELCRVYIKVSSITFGFRRHISFEDLRQFMQTALKRSRIALLDLNGDIDEFLSFGLLDALSSSVVVEELRLDFRCHYESETLTDLCTEAVNVWKTTALGLYNPLHSQTIFGNAELTRKLSRLEVSVPTVDCRKELDALLFGNQHLEARLQFINGHSRYWGQTLSCLVSAVPSCAEETFFVPYFESVFRRISDDTHEDDFVRILYIRSVFEFFPYEVPPTVDENELFDDSGFLRRRAGDVEDERTGLAFNIYEAGSHSRRYHVFWGWQMFYDSNYTLTDTMDYYVITSVSEPVRRDITQVYLGRFADWTIRGDPFAGWTNEAIFEQLYAAKDWLPECMRHKASRVGWSHG